jgi:hypothetical protein
VVGGQAIGRFADGIGLYIGAMWRKGHIPGIRANWPPDRAGRLRLPLDLPRQPGELIGLKA